MTPTEAEEINDDLKTLLMELGSMDALTPALILHLRNAMVDALSRLETQAERININLEKICDEMEREV